jgi:hypothetical protein
MAAASIWRTLQIEQSFANRFADVFSNGSNYRYKLPIRLPPRIEPEVYLRVFVDENFH